MTTSAAVPAILTGDLLTGSEWNAARVRDLFQLAADVKAHPEQYRTALAGRFDGVDHGKGLAAHARDV